MKKVILALAIAATAVCAQAAAVKWDSGTVKDMSGANIGTKAATAGWVASVTFWDETGKDVIATTGLSDNTASMSKFNATTGSDFATSTSYMAQLVITDDKGNTVTSDKALFTTDSSATFQLNFGTGNGFATSGAKINYASGWVAAPEPTSGLLLLLGMAGLALKRKRA